MSERSIPQPDNVDALTDADISIDNELIATRTDILLGNDGATANDTTEQPVEASNELDNDRALVLSAQTNPEEFGKIYTTYRTLIYTYIFKRIGNPSRVEELTQDVFQRALNALPRFELKAPITAWLYRIAHNISANYLRDHATDPVDQSAPLFEDIPYKPIAVKLIDDYPIREVQILYKALKMLTPEEREILELKFTQELSNLEIGNTIGRTESAVKSQLHRINTKLLKIMQGLGVDGVEDL